MPCKQCERVYSGEAGRQVAVRMTGHTKEVEMGSRISVSQYHKSAITDCVCYNNLIMDY